MTISTTASATTLGGNGVTTAFNFGFIAGTASNVLVIYTDANGIQTTLTPSQYNLVLTAAVAGQIWGIGGTVTYPTSGAPIAAGTSLTIERIVPLTQLVSISNQGDFYPQVVEKALDTLCLEIQQVSARTGQIRGIWQSGVVYNYGDIVQDGNNGASTFNLYTCAVANTSGVWATDLAAGDWSLALNVQNLIVVGSYLPLAGGTILGNLTVNGIFDVGAPGYAGTNVAIQATKNANSYVQAIVQNTNAGTTASADLVVSNNSSTDTTFYGNFGMNSSGFTGTGSFNKASAVYLTSTSGDLVIGSTTANAVRFVYNNGTTDAAFFDSSGWNFLTANINQTNSVNGTTSIQINNTNVGASASAQLVLNNGTTLTQFVHTGTGAGAANNFFISSGVSGERLRFDASGRITLGGAAVATGYTNAGDVTMGALNNIRANNTAKAWVELTGTGSATLIMGFNISSVTRTGTGAYQINLTNAIGGGTAYPVVTGVNNASTTIGDRQCCANVASSSQFYLVSGLTASGTVFDAANIMAVAYANT